MAEQREKNLETDVLRNPGPGFLSTHLATLFTALFAVVLIFMLWTYGPDYKVLMHNLDSSRLAKVTTELQKANIAYQYDSQSGSVLVPENSLYHAKFVLGSRGLGPETVSQLLPDQDAFAQQPGTGSGTLLEAASGKTQYFALEAELAKTVSSINNIQSARVHLALKESGNGQQSDKSRASVFVRLMPGRTLGEAQLSSISQLISASVPGMAAENVAVIDHSGNLLKSTSDSSSNTLQSRRYSYVRMLEQSYINKIESVLTPIFGEDALRIRVDADVSFSNPGQFDSSAKINQHDHSIGKLLVTVVVDNKYAHNNSGQLVSFGRSTKELQRIESLTRDAISFDAQRGDQINVFNEPFTKLASTEQEFSLLENTRSQYYMKIFMIAALGILLVYMVLRFVIQKIMELKPVNLIAESNTGHVERSLSTSESEHSGMQSSKEANGGSSENVYEALLLKTRKQVEDNPAHVARVIKAWVRDNGR